MVSLVNSADFFAQDNHRVVSCQFSPNPSEFATEYLNGFGGGSDVDVSNGNLTLVTAVSSGSSINLALQCSAEDGGTDQSYVDINTVRINATAVDNINSQ
jgi:hypothetical protein